MTPDRHPLSIQAIGAVQAEVVPLADSPLHAGCFQVAEPLLLALDRMTDGVLVCDLDGVVRLRNAAMSNAVDATPRGERLHREVTEFLDEIRSDGSCMHRRLVRTREGSAVLEGGFVPEGQLLAGPALLVVLQLGVHPPLDAAHLQERFSLSDREAGVLCLLTEGRSNREVSQALRISEHTVRHHVEHILLKLHVRSRAAAVARVLRG